MSADHLPPSMLPTPGPWAADGYEVRQPGGRMVAYCGPHHTPPDEYPVSCRLQDEANARLIASAPEMAERISRMERTFEDNCDKLVDFMARAIEAEHDADNLAEALTEARDTLAVALAWPGSEALRSKIHRALAEHQGAADWRNGVLLHRYKDALRQIRRAAVALKRDTDDHAFSPGTVECSKSAIRALFTTIDSYTKDENDHA